jgi:hypothetical protein
MVALVIEEHPVPAVEKNIPVSERGFKVLFFLLSFCNSIMALFIFFARVNQCVPYHNYLNFYYPRI